MANNPWRNKVHIVSNTDSQRWWDDPLDIFTPEAFCGVVVTGGLDSDFDSLAEYIDDLEYQASVASWCEYCLKSYRFSLAILAVKGLL